MPDVLKGSYLFHISSKGHKNKTYSIEVWNETTIYIGIQKYRNTKITDFLGILNKNGWQQEEVKLITDCCTIDEIWKKKMTTTGLHTVILPVIETDEFLMTIFVTGMTARDLI